MSCHVISTLSVGRRIVAKSTLVSKIEPIIEQYFSVVFVSSTLRLSQIKGSPAASLSAIHPMNRSMSRQHNVRSSHHSANKGNS